MKRGYGLEQSRSDKIVSLGCLCYNLYVEGVMVFPEMNRIVPDIKKLADHLSNIRRGNYDDIYISNQEYALRDKLMELGCVCYNLYVDSRLFNSNVLSLCDTISSINYEITNGAKGFKRYDSKDGYEKPKNISKSNRSTAQSELKVACPYGMEPIPAGFKKCVCGYRNRPEARFCGKCGAKLS